MASDKHSTARQRRRDLRTWGPLLLAALLILGLVLGRLLTPTPPVVRTPAREAAATATATANADGTGVLLDRENAYRSGKGLAALVRSASLDGVAESLARDMAERGYFSPTDPQGRTPYDRVGGTWPRVAENLLKGTSSPAAVVESWLAAPPYRQNLEDASWAAVGIGRWPQRDVTGTPTVWVELFAGLKP